jgi:hypothetical protein
LITREIYSLTLKTTNKDKADLPITNVINSFRVCFRLIYFILLIIPMPNPAPVALFLRNEILYLLYTDY